MTTAFQPANAAEAAMIDARERSDPAGYLTALASVPVLVAHLPGQGVPSTVMVERDGRRHLLLFTSRAAAQRGQQLHGQGQDWNLIEVPLATILRQWRGAETWLTIDPGTPLETYGSRDELVRELTGVGIDLGDVSRPDAADQPQPFRLPMMAARAKSVAVGLGLLVVGPLLFGMGIAAPNEVPVPIALTGLAGALFGGWRVWRFVNELRVARTWQGAQPVPGSGVPRVRRQGLPPVPVILACACMVPGTLVSVAAGIGLALVGFRDRDLTLTLAVPLGVLCLAMIALHTIGIARAWRGTSAMLLKVPAYLTIGLLALFALLYLWTEIDQGNAELEPSMVVIPALAALAGAAVLLLRTTAATAWLPTGAPPARLPPGPHEVDLRPVVGIAVLMSGAYAVYLLLNVLRPKLPMEPAVSIFDDRLPPSVRVAFWGVVTSWLVVPVVLLVAAVLRRAGPASWRLEAVRLVVVAVLLLPFVTVPLATALGNPSLMLVCVPSTAFALWAVHRTQRYRRVPVRLLLSAFAWGAFVAGGLSFSLTLLLSGSAYSFVLQDDPDLPRATYRVLTALLINAGPVEELSKGAGIAMAYLMFRRHLDGVVAGVVLGAAVGLGFNFLETVDYMAQANGAAAEYQYWMRQSIGLLGAHTAFSALVGGGFGVARQLREPWRRRLAITSGLVVAVGSHTAANVLFFWFSQVKGSLVAPGGTLDILVLQPLLLVVLNGPLIAVSVFLIRRGLRSEQAGLAAALRAEAATGLGAVSPIEILVLLNPARRLWVGVMVLRRHGLRAWRRLRQVQAAQLDLAAELWHRARQDVDAGSGDERALRDRVLRLKGVEPRASAFPARPVGAPA